jgi:hypothetical protein
MEMKMMMDYDDSNDTFTVSLTIEDGNDTVTKQFTLPYDESWTTVMAKVADGLSAYYGYDLKEKLRFVVTYPECHRGTAGELCISKQDFESFMESQSNL